MVFHISQTKGIYITFSQALSVTYVKCTHSNYKLSAYNVLSSKKYILALSCAEPNKSRMTFFTLTDKTKYHYNQQHYLESDVEFVVKF